MTPRDPYQVLGVPGDASGAAIRRAYKKLARRYHPDVNPGDAGAEERFKEISEAYALLSDPQKKKAFDRFGGGSPGGSGSAWNQPGGFGFEPGGVSGLGDLLSRLFGGGAGRSGHSGPARSRRGEALEAVLSISFHDAIRGFTTPLTLTRQVLCSTCGGTGSRSGDRPTACRRCAGTGRASLRRGPVSVQTACPECGGQGRTGARNCPPCAGQGRRARQETIQVKIPPGVAEGARLKVAGKGNVGADGSSGDLYVTVRVDAHPVFERRGDNIYCTVPVTVTEAALGTRIEVPTVDGSARLTIPPGTQSSQQLRLRGKGAPSRRGGRGDQFVEVRVLVPLVKDAETRELLKRLDRHIEKAPREPLFTRAG